MFGVGNGPAGGLRGWRQRRTVAHRPEDRQGRREDEDPVRLRCGGNRRCGVGQRERQERREVDRRLGARRTDAAMNYYSRCMLP